METRRNSGEKNNGKPKLLTRSTPDPTHHRQEKQPIKAGLIGIPISYVPQSEARTNDGQLIRTAPLLKVAQKHTRATAQGIYSTYEHGQALGYIQTLTQIIRRDSVVTTTVHEALQTGQYGTAK